MPSRTKIKKPTYATDAISHDIGGTLSTMMLKPATMPRIKAKNTLMPRRYWPNEEVLGNL